MLRLGQLVEPQSSADEQPEVGQGREPTAARGQGLDVFLSLLREEIVDSCEAPLPGCAGIPVPPGRTDALG